jgi:uncharacterized protein YndB with AHSA1/START domain
MTTKTTTEVTTPSDREIAMTRVFNAPREMVFEAWTTPDLLRKWLLGPPGWEMTVCDIDLRVGGRYRYVWRKEDGAEMGMGGTFREIDRPARMVTTELFDEDWTGGETLVTQTFDEKDGKTTATTLVRYASKEARDGALKSGMTDGVDISYDRLEELLAK